MTNDPRNIFFDQRNAQTEQTDTPQQTTATQTTVETEQAEQTFSQEQSVEQRVEQMKRLASKYQREGEGQLVRDIVNNVVEQKARGQLSNEQLQAFGKRVAPLLNADQRQRLNDLMEQLMKI